MILTHKIPTWLPAARWWSVAAQGGGGQAGKGEREGEQGKEGAGWRWLLVGGEARRRLVGKGRRWCSGK